jgi:guanylate kinase
MNKLMLILSGPSGSGKSSLTKKLFKVLDKYYFSISTTTREPREGEKDGIDYYFTTKENFLKDIKNDCFLEYAQIHGNYYGTAKKPIQKAQEDGKLVIFDIDVQGQKQIVAKMNEFCISVFITTSTIQELRVRLENRNTDSKEVIDKRIINAQDEMSHIKNYDYLLINDDLDKTFQNLKNIVNIMPLIVKQNKINKLISNWS